MSDPLFDPDKCNVPEVPKIDFAFVSECSIAEPPPPIYDCLSPIVPRDPPTLCPVFETSVNVRANLPRGECPSIALAPTGVMIVTKTDTDPCKFLIDLDLDVPPIKLRCPGFASGAVTVEVGYSGCVSGPTGALLITKEIIPGNCSIYDSCQYTIDLDLKIPLPPPPCPEITATGAIAIKEDITTPTIDFTVEAQTEEIDCEKKCKFDFTLDIELPKICPEITATAVIEKKADVAEPTIEFTVTKDPDDCKFDFDLDIVIPEICPEIKATAVIEKKADVAEPTIEFTVTKDPDFCKFDFDLDIVIPEICPEIKATGTIYSATDVAEPTMVFELVKDPDFCKFDLNLDIVLPYVCTPEFKATGSVIVTPGRDEPSAAFVITEDPPCNYLLDFALELPVPCTPEFVVEHNILCTPGRDDVTCTKFEITEDETEKCKYNATLDIEMPCPRPCPDFTGSISVYEAPALTGTLIVTHIPPENATEQCAYALDIKLGIKPMGEPVELTYVSKVECVNNEIIVTTDTITVYTPPIV